LSPAIARGAVVLPARALLPLFALALATSAWTGAAHDLASTALRAARTLAP
jgi:hypothetical protein